MPKQGLPVEKPPRRVVSLVPSLTESFFDLGLGDCIVGITDYCIHPADALKGIPRLGGPKNPHIDQILALAPDLVVANQEENSPAGIHALQQAGIPVWLTFPLTVADALSDIALLADRYANQPAQVLVAQLRQQVELARQKNENRDRKRVFCPIWQDGHPPHSQWWMTFNQQTYPNDLLEILGAENVFHGRARRYPLAADLGEIEPEEAGERDTRYPRVRLEEILVEDPEIVLLPNEPYDFTKTDAETFQTLLEERLGHPVRVERIDGSLLFWPGTRLGKALGVLSAIFHD